MTKVNVFNYDLDEPNIYQRGVVLIEINGNIILVCDGIVGDDTFAGTVINKDDGMCEFGEYRDDWLIGEFKIFLGKIEIDTISK